MQITQLPPQIPTQVIPQNNLNTKFRKDYKHHPYNNPSFTSREVDSSIFEFIKKLPPVVLCTKGMDKLTTGLAYGFAKILHLKPIEHIIEKTKNEPLLTAHLSALTSVVLSGFYMKKTLENKQLDPQKRRTLAINQGAVWVVSTTLSYSLERIIRKKITKFTDKFLIANIKKDIPQLVKFKSGITSASQLMIFGTMYRFIAPVLVTPLANHIGNKLQERQDAKIASKND